MDRVQRHGQDRRPDHQAQEWAQQQADQQQEPAQHRQAERDVDGAGAVRLVGPDARTVAEIVGNPAKLKDKTVVVRGKVVKYTPEVMGKNWLHLRDGSGSAADGTNDILVTSAEPASIGDVVVAKGTVRTDVNLGSGYSYKVLVDEATLQK